MVLRRGEGCDFVSKSNLFRILRRMKNRLRDLASVLVLCPLLLAGCSESAQLSPAPEKSLLGDDPVAAIVEILEIPERFERTETLMAALRELPAAQIGLLEDVLKERQKPHREFDRVLIVSAWSKIDPASATKWAMKRESRDFLRQTMFSESAYRWALNDPAEMREDFKVGMYSLQGWDPSMLRGFVQGWHESGEPNLEEFIRDLGRGSDDQQRAISQLINLKLATETPDAMIAWAMSLDGELRYRRYVYSRLAADIAVTDPKRALAWCDEVCGSDVGENMPHWIAASWVRESGAEAMDWIMTQGDSLAVQVGIRASYRRFTKSEPEAADAWIEQSSEEMRSSESLQGPVIMYVQRQANLANYENAIDWVKYIENDWERERSFSHIARQWLRRDEEAAELWLSTTDDLDDSVKRKLRGANQNRVEQAEKKLEARRALPQWVKDEM